LNVYHLLFRLIALIFAGVLGMKGSWGVVSPPEAWRQPSRTVGAPLTGYWRVALADACYDFAPVLHFRQDRVDFYHHPQFTTYPNPRYVMLEDGRIEIHMSANPARSAKAEKLVFRDHGDRLEWMMTLVDGVRNPPGYSNSPDLVNCGTYTTGDRLALMFRRPFHPADYH